MMRFKSFLPVIIFAFVAVAASQTLQNFSSGGASLSGGVNNTIPKWTGASTLGNSSLIDNGTVITGTEPIQQANGTASVTAYGFSANPNTGLFQAAANFPNVSVNGTAAIGWTSGLLTELGGLLTWGAGGVGGAQTTGLNIAAPGVVEVDLGSAGTNGWLMQRGARIGLAADYTNATAALTATNLSVTLIAGRKYNFVVELFVSDSTAAEGATVAFDGGSATVTNFRVQGELYNQAPTLLLVSAATALATTHTIASVVVTTQCHWHFAGTFEVNAAGTFIIRASQNSHTSGTLTINRGSFLWIEDMVYN